MTTITAALINSEFETTVATADLEVIINSAIDTVNSDAGTTIGYLAGAPGSITVTGNQAAAIKPLIAMKIASNKVAGGSSNSTSIGGLSESGSSNVGASNSNSQLYDRAIQKLRVRPRFAVATDEPI